MKSRLVALAIGVLALARAARTHLVRSAEGKVAAARHAPDERHQRVVTPEDLEPAVQAPQAAMVAATEKELVTFVLANADERVTHDDPLPIPAVHSRSEQLRVASLAPLLGGCGLG